MNTLRHFLLWSVGLASAETQTTDLERSRLRHYAADRHRLVEIGVWHGVTTKLLRCAMAADGVLFAVDPFPRGRLGVSFQRIIAHREVSQVRRGRVEWVEMRGVDAGVRHRSLGLAPVEFLFIDGDHSYEGLAGDWNVWRDCVAPGGCVALHDSRATPTRGIHMAGSARFTREVILTDREFRCIEEIDSLTVVQRQGTVAPKARTA